MISWHLLTVDLVHAYISQGSRVLDVMKFLAIQIFAVFIFAFRACIRNDIRKLAPFEISRSMVLENRAITVSTLIILFGTTTPTYPNSFYRIYANKTEDLINGRKFASWNLCNSN